MSMSMYSGGMYPGGMSPGSMYSPYGGYGYGNYYGINDPNTGKGIGSRNVEKIDKNSTPLSLPEELNGELHRDSTSKKGLIIGSLSGAAVGATAGALIAGSATLGIGAPVGAVIGGILGLVGGAFAGDKLGNIVAVQEDVDKDGKVDGNGIAQKEANDGFFGIF
jgi:hypothetical protein